MFLLLCLNMCETQVLMKNKIVLFVTGCFVLLLSSCLGSDDDDNGNYILAKNCQISSFVLKHDSITLANGKGLDSLRFTIDQINGRIFNIDSLPYGTQLSEVICNITYMNPYAVMSNNVYQLGASEPLAWNGSDSLDFSQPVRFVVGAYDGETTKTYWAQVNIHQVQPDSMAWSLYADLLAGQSIAEQKVIAYNDGNTDNYLMYTKTAAGYQLYQSAATDAKKWSEQTLTGLPDEGLRLAQLTAFNEQLYLPAANGVMYTSKDGQQWTAADKAPAVTYLLGEVKAGRNQGALLAGIANIDGQLTFVAMDEQQQWQTGDIVPSNFPVSGFGNINYDVMYQEYLMVVAGRDTENQLTNARWSTTNGRTWVLINADDRNAFAKREGVMLVPYDDRFFLIGGIGADGKANKDIYQSSDYGINWAADTTHVLPSEYEARGFSSAIVDKEQYILLFGGKTTTNSNELNQLWRGRINRLGFKKQ